MDEKTDLPVESFDKALAELSSMAKDLTGLVEAVRTMKRTTEKGRNIALYAAGELAQALKLAVDLRKYDLASLLGSAGEGVSLMEQEASRTAEREVQRLLADLDEKLGKEGFSLAGHYPELSCDVFTIAFDATSKGMEVSVFYGPRIARLAVVAGAEVDKIVEAVVASAKELERSLIPQDQAISTIFNAWKAACFRKGVPVDDARMPILDVMVQTCFLKQSDQFFRNPVKAAFAAYGQVSFAQQLFTLAQREHEGRELVLGIATREDVKHKQSLWVPRNRKGEGVHYSTLSFRGTT